MERLQTAALEDTAYHPPEFSAGEGQNSRSRLDCVRRTVNHTGVPPPTARPTPRPRAVFDGAAALRHLERLVAIGPRHAGSPGAARARKYIVDELRKLGVSVRVDAFDATTPHGRLPMANVVASVPGAART